MKTNKQNTFGNKAARFVGLFLVLGVLLGVSSTEVFAQVPPANTNIGNQASATYLDNGGNTQSITSNTVITVVQQVAGVDITDGISLTVSPSGQVTFNHTITNLGNGVDSFQLSVLEGSGDFTFDNISIYADVTGDGVPDNFDDFLDPANSDITPAINANGTYGILIVADIPVTATEGDVQTIQITATSVFDSNESDSGTNTTTVDEDAVINVTKDRDKQFVEVGDTVTYTFDYAESGGTSAGANLVIRDPLPAGVTYLPESGVWSGAAGVPLTDTDASETATGITFKYVDSTVDSVVIEIGSINAGASGTVSFKVVVDAETYGQTITNTGIYSHDDAPTPTNTNPATIEVAESFGIQAVGADTVFVASAEQGEIVNFLNVYINTGTASDDFNITYSGNTFPSTPTFYQVDSNNQPTSTYQDSDGDNNPDVVNVAPGDTIKVITQIILPSGTSGGPYSLVKTLTSVGDPDSSAFHTDVLGEITTPIVDITNVAELGDGSETGAGTGPEESPVTTTAANPGNSIDFTLYINNTSALDDTYQLDFATDTTTTGGDLSGVGALPTGWTASFRDPNNGNAVITSVDVDAGQFAEVFLRVDVPAGYEPGTTSIFVRAESQTTGARDIKHEAVTVNTVRLMTLISDQSGQVSPGGSVDYIHTLTITSNVDENEGTNSDLYLELSNSVPTGWTARVYWDTDENGTVTGADSLLTSAASSGAIDLPSSVGTLQFGDQLYFIVQVTSSNGLDDGATVTTTLEITDFVEDLAAVSNNDLTEVQAGRLSIDKFQAPDSLGQAGTFTKAQFDVLPGDTVYYQVVIVNDGSEPVTNVVVQDVVPSYTTILIAATYTIDSGTITSVVLDAGNPTVGNTGTVRLDIDQLDPTEQVTLSFAVKVDDD